MNPIFFQFRNEINHLDRLIKLFELDGWVFEKATTDYFHDYSWPDIRISDKAGILPHFDNDTKDSEENYGIELLGCYNQADGNINEGIVTLYMPKIKQVAYSYWNHKFAARGLYDLDAEKYFTELVSTVILIHEFVHWIIHWIGSPGFIDYKITHRYRDLNYSNKDEVYFHESLAQLFTKFICTDSSELYNLFEWLENRQPRQYTAYKGLINDNELDRGVSKILRLLLFMRQYDLQSFDILQLLFEIKIDEVDDSECLDLEVDDIQQTFICTNIKIANYYFQQLLSASNEQVNKQSLKIIWDRAKEYFPELTR